MKWFAAIYLMSEAKKGVSANQLKRNLGVAYKTVWYLCHRIRAAVKDADTTLLDGIIEVNETYIGGKAKKMHTKERAEKIQECCAAGKAMAIGAIKRAGGVRLTVAKSNDRRTLHNFIKAQLDGNSEYIMTNEWPAYDGIADENARHETVNHRIAEYLARGVPHEHRRRRVVAL
jgi:hypothetical protein